jgi:putative restriction endonuclease
VEPFVAQTDKHWFDHLEFLAGPSRWVDEVNFWSPSALLPLKQLTPGEPIFFRLKNPHDCIAGYGFFAHFALLRLDQAWGWFGEKNGDPDEVSFLERIGSYRGLDLLDPRARREPLGCTILRDARFWPRDRWIPWGQAQGWKPNLVRGKTERDLVHSSRLLGEIQFDHQGIPEEFEAHFELIETDERALRLAASRPREGQGAFRSRLLDAYGRRCAIPGEHTEIVLEAAHIQPYLGPRSNHLQNGLLLTREFHALFDAGYVTVTPDHEVRVSPRLRSEWDNGHRYYPFDGTALNVPTTVSQQPSRDVLEWHACHRFLG